MSPLPIDNELVVIPGVNRIHQISYFVPKEN